MGKLVTVKTGYVAVLLPDSHGSGGYRNYEPGDTVIVTDAEYAAFNSATTQAITLTTSNLPDPYRLGNDPGAGLDEAQGVVTGAATANVGWNDWVLTGNVTSVTVAPANVSTQTVVGSTIVVGLPVYGASPGSSSTVCFRLTQDATGSRTVTWGSKFKFVGGSAPVLTTAANAVDIVKFVTLDGGNTFLETDRDLNIH
jgi:hypothetical protein